MVVVPLAPGSFLTEGVPERWISTPQHGRENHCAMLVIKRGIYIKATTWHHGISKWFYFFQPSKHI